MNKTEPVRASEELRDFGSSDLAKLDTAKLTNFDSASPNESFASAVRNLETPALTDSACSALLNSGTSVLHEGVSS